MVKSMLNYDEQTYCYYKFGIHCADMIFTKDSILHNEKDIRTNEWTGLKTLDKSDEKYALPFIEIKKCLYGIQDVDWEGKDEITLSWGAYYQKYIKFVSEDREAWVWVQRNIKSPLDLIIEKNKPIGFILTKRDGCIILVKPGLEGLTPLKYWNDPALSSAEYTVNHIGKFYVNMGDGIKLATDVWLPGIIFEKTKVPTILVRTPYGRFSLGEIELRFVQRGYAVVAQDTRGREDSEGEWIPMTHEMNDGDDTLKWIAQQSWSNGKVGMIGGSYGGYVQWAAAASGNPYLKAIISLVTAGSPFVDIPRKGGALLSGVLAWSFAMAERKLNFEALVREDWDKVINTLPIKDIPQKALGRDIPFWNEWMKHPDYDEFWEKADWTIYGGNIDVPSLIISGWYDDNGMGTSEAWDITEKYERENQRLILGPWYHQANTTRDIHNISFGKNAIRYDLDILYLRWFDHFLKDIDNGVEKESRVTYYMVGNNEWKESNKWPPEKMQYLNFYLHSQGNANTRLGNGYLNLEVPYAEPMDQYDFDPEDPAPHLVDISENEMSVPENYKGVEEREDVLVYTTESLKEELAIAGDVYAILYASSSARDTDWVVRLTDVDEKGNSIRLSDGIIRARYRKTFKEPELIEQDKIEKYEVRMTKIANVFKKGHKIRIEVTSGAKNLVFPNHNTGNDPAADTEYIVANQRVFHNSSCPSHVKLPVVVWDNNL